MAQVMGKRLPRKRTMAKRVLPAPPAPPAPSPPEALSAQAAALSQNPQTRGHAAARASLVSHDESVAAARRRIADAQAGTAARAAANANPAAAAEEATAADALAAQLDADLASKLTKAVRYAVSMFCLQAKFRDIRINAVAAMGTPGCLDGPRLEPFIRTAPDVAAMTGPVGELRDAVAEGVADAFAQWRAMVVVPGAPWYPAFAAFPGPMAPPTPAIPWPLTALPSSGLPEITSPSRLAGQMKDALPDALDTPAIRGFLDKLAASLSTGLAAWTASATVTNVMGAGPVPTFAPPFVPVGPVINGWIISAPGHLAAAPPMPVIPVAI